MFIYCRFAKKGQWRIYLRIPVLPEGNRKFSGYRNESG